jgi:hypothetical protein
MLGVEELVQRLRVFCQCLCLYLGQLVFVLEIQLSLNLLL